MEERINPDVKKPIAVDSPVIAATLIPGKFITLPTLPRLAHVTETVPVPVLAAAIHAPVQLPLDPTLTPGIKLANLSGFF